MNATIEKFGFPNSLVAEFDHWLVLVRPQQVTLGSLVLAANSDATSFGSLVPEAFAEQREVVAAIERALTDFVAYERINYLMLMMVDPHVHFHVFPRYADTRSWGGRDFVDQGWPGPPQLTASITLEPDEIRLMADRISINFR